MIPSFKSSKHANRGKKAEDTVHDFLKEWESKDTHREAERLLDSKAAGRIVKAAAADFAFYAVADAPRFGLIEVKETEHNYRLSRSKVPQLPRMRKRAKSGGWCFVLVHHSLTKLWRVVSTDWMVLNGDKGSWDLTGQPSFQTPGEALAHIAPWAFRA